MNIINVHVEEGKYTDGHNLLANISEQKMYWWMERGKDGEINGETRYKIKRHVTAGAGHHPNHCFSAASAKEEELKDKHLLWLGFGEEVGWGPAGS